MGKEDNELTGGAQSPAGGGGGVAVPFPGGGGGGATSLALPVGAGGAPDLYILHGEFVSSHVIFLESG